MAFEKFKSFLGLEKKETEGTSSQLDLKGLIQERRMIPLDIKLTSPCVFVERELEEGDFIRVERSNGEYNYGIFVSEDEVYYISWSFYPNNFADSKPERKTLKSFLCGDKFEVRVFTEDQRKYIQDKKTIVANAICLFSNFHSFNLIWNDLAHFANICAYVNDINSFINNSPIPKSPTEEIEEIGEIEERGKINSMLGRFEKNITPQRGDHIKVQRYKSYFHHGIYVSDTEVYNIDGEYDIRKLKYVKPECTTLEKFRDGGDLYVRQFSDEEREKINDVETIVSNAKRIFYNPDNKGYHVLTNNCETFANTCLFIKHANNVKKGIAGSAQAIIGSTIVTVLVVGGTILKVLGSKNKNEEKIL